MNTATHPVAVKTLDHVTVVVKDLQRSRRFYVDQLGMEEVARPGFSFSGSWFQAGATQIHLILEHDESGPAGNAIEKELASSRTHHFAFEVADSFAAAEFLKSQDVPIVSGPKQRPDGAVQTFVLDPDGYVVELCQPPQAGA